MKARNSGRFLLCSFGALLLAFAACATTDGLRDDWEKCRQGVQEKCQAVQDKCNSLLNPTKKEEKKNDGGESNSSSSLYRSEDPALAAVDGEDEGYSLFEATLLLAGAQAGTSGLPSGVSKEDACAVCAICAQSPGVKIPAACNQCGTTANS